MKLLKHCLLLLGVLLVDVQLIAVDAVPVRPIQAVDAVRAWQQGITEVPNCKFKYLYEMKGDPKYGVPDIKRAYEFCKFNDKYYSKHRDVGGETERVTSYNGKVFHENLGFGVLKMSTDVNKLKESLVGDSYSNPILRPYCELFAFTDEVVVLPTMSNSQAWADIVRTITKVQAAKGGPPGALEFTRETRHTAQHLKYFKDGTRKVTISYEPAFHIPFQMSIEQLVTGPDGTRSLQGPTTLKIRKWLKISLPEGGRTISIPSVVVHAGLGKGEGEVLEAGVERITLDESSFKLLSQEPPIGEFQVPRASVRKIWDMDLNVTTYK